MQPIKFLGRLAIILLLISCVCSVLAETEDIHARKVKAAGVKAKAKPKVAAPKVKAKPKAKTATKAKPKPKPKPKPKTKAKTAAKAAPKKKAPAKAAPKTKAPAKAAPKTKAPAKATPKGKTPAKTPAKTPGKTPAKKPAPKTNAKSCPIPKKKVRPRAFGTDEELHAYYGVVKRDITRDVAIRGRSIEKRTNVCGFHELRDQDQAERGCSGNTARFVVDPATGNLVKQGQGRVAGVACDHIIELQLVADVMENTGACKSAELMLKAGGFKAGGSPTSLADKMKQLIDKHIVPVVNGGSNVIFLDSGVNQSKKTYVQKFKGKATASLPDPATANNGADAAKIRTYLTDVTILNQSTRGAVLIDTAIAKFLEDAKKEALKELQSRKDKAGAQCTETQQTGFATDESVISAEPQRSKKAQFPSTQTLWAKISDL